MAETRHLIGSEDEAELEKPTLPMEGHTLPDGFWMFKWVEERLVEAWEFSHGCPPLRRYQRVGISALSRSQLAAHFEPTHERRARL